MAEQFGYQDKEGRFYPDHPALRFEPGLVPGYYDHETKKFRAVGNPREQRGTIVTDAGFGDSDLRLQSGLVEDKGADTAPLQGVAFTQTNEQAQAELDKRNAENVELRQKLEASQRENAQWRARDELAKEPASGETDPRENDPDDPDDPDAPFVGPPRPNAPNEDTGRKLVRRASKK
jgi:hypothetical protein